MPNDTVTGCVAMGGSVHELIDIAPSKSSAVACNRVFCNIEEPTAITPRDAVALNVFANMPEIVSVVGGLCVAISAGSMAEPIAFGSPCDNVDETQTFWLLVMMITTRNLLEEVEDLSKLR